MNSPGAVGIVSYGTALPQWSLSAKKIAESRGEETAPALGVEQKTVADHDEDTLTLATSAGWQALQRLPSDVLPHVQQNMRSLFIGSESHPYAVKPTGTIVANTLGLSSQLSLADLQFACKAGTQALQIVSKYVSADKNSFGMAIGADTAQSRPGDILEYTAAAGAAAYILAQPTPQAPLLAELLATTSYATDTPDFWRKPGELYPQHAGRFTGEPAYFHHVSAATQAILQQTSAKISDFDYCIFHTPNGKFPELVAKQLGCTSTQLQHSLPVKKIGNTYAAATMLAFANVLDHATEGQTILVTSYGSGAGADSFVWKVTSALESARKNWHDLLQERIEKLQPTTYQQYRQWQSVREGQEL